MNSKNNIFTAMASAGVPHGITVGIDNAVKNGVISEAKARRMLAAWVGEKPAPKAPKHAPQRVAAARTPPDTRSIEERLTELEIFRFGASRAPAQVVKSPEHTAQDSAELRRRMGLDKVVPGAVVATPHRLTLGGLTESEVKRASKAPAAEGPRLPEAERIELGLRMGALEVRSDGVEKTPHRLTLGAPRYVKTGTRK